MTKSSKISNLRISYSAGSSPTQTTFTYDSDGNVTTKSIYENGRLTSYTKYAVKAAQKIYFYYPPYPTKLISPINSFYQTDPLPLASAININHLISKYFIDDSYFNHSEFIKELNSKYSIYTQEQLGYSYVFDEPKYLSKTFTHEIKKSEAKEQRHGINIIFERLSKWKNLTTRRCMTT